jgi:hypothetical protein
MRSGRGWPMQSGVRASGDLPRRTQVSMSFRQEAPSILLHSLYGHARGRTLRSTTAFPNEAWTGLLRKNLCCLHSKGAAAIALTSHPTVDDTAHKVVTACSHGTT